MWREITIHISLTEQGEYLIMQFKVNYNKRGCTKIQKPEVGINRSESGSFLTSVSENVKISESGFFLTSVSKETGGGICSVIHIILVCKYGGTVYGWMN